MRFDGNYGSQVNYQPNSFNGPIDDKQFSEPPLKFLVMLIAMIIALAMTITTTWGSLSPHECRIKKHS